MMLKGYESTVPYSCFAVSYVFSPAVVCFVDRLSAYVADVKGAFRDGCFYLLKVFKLTDSSPSFHFYPREFPYFRDVSFTHGHIFRNLCNSKHYVCQLVSYSIACFKCRCHLRCFNTKVNLQTSLQTTK